jgi:hypothetical protein
MRALSYLLSGFIGVFLVIFDRQAEVWAQTASLDWRIFEVPEYGTRVDYPARIFAPAGQPEKGIGQRFESADRSAVLSVYSRLVATGRRPLAKYINGTAPPTAPGRDLALRRGFRHILDFCRRGRAAGIRRAAGCR